MQINIAHIRARSTSGGAIDYAVFDARSSSGMSSDNELLLAQLTARARSAGLKVDQSALAYNHNGRTQFFGSRHLVDHLAQQGGVPQWTHKIDA
jgi:hypothetical protein